MVASIAAILLVSVVPKNWTTQQISVFAPLYLGANQPDISLRADSILHIMNHMVYKKTYLVASADVSRFGRSVVWGRVE